MRRAVWVSMVLLLLVDAWTKYWVQAHLWPMRWLPFSYPYGGIGIFKDFLGIEFSLTYATNHGAAWGLFSSYPQALLAVRLFCIGGLFAYLWLKKMAALPQLALGLVAAGALGNVVDIALYGHVVDMFHVVFWGYSYPVFNIADSAICLGVFLYLISPRFCTAN